MAYTKTNWVNGYTPLNASNMNKIEEGIFNNDTFLSSLNVRVENLEGSIGQGGIGSIVVNGNGNALTNASYNPSTKILNFEKNNTFALDSDNEKSLYHLGAYDSISGNVITRQTGYVNLIDLVNSFSRYQWNDTIFQTIVPLSEIGSLGEETSLRKYILSDNINYTRANVYAAGAADYTVSILNDILSVKNTNNDINVLKQYLLQHPLIIQYKLATSYTEEIIEGQPLNTLDQSGSQWLRSEWEKGLNLLKEDVRKLSNWVIILGDVNLKAGVIYNLWTDVTFPDGQKAVLKDVNDNILAFTGYTFAGNNYFKLSSNYSGQINLSGMFSDVNPTKAMINEGNHAYPYQHYQGAIVREKQLNDRLNFKRFDASNSTINDVLDYIQQNYENIISIIYYAKSGGEAFGRSVIYNADEGILAYITSSLTFANVELNTDAEEGSDYIIIYKKH